MSVATPWVAPPCGLIESERIGHTLTKKCRCGFQFCSTPEITDYMFATHLGEQPKGPCPAYVAPTVARTAPTSIRETVRITHELTQRILTRLTEQARNGLTIDSRVISAIHDAEMSMLQDLTRSA